MHHTSYPNSESDPEEPGRKKVRCGDFSGEVMRYSCLLLSSPYVLLSTLTTRVVADRALRWSTGRNLVTFLRHPLSCHVDVLYANGRSRVTVVITTLPASPGQHIVIIIIIIIIIIITIIIIIMIIIIHSFICSASNTC